MCTILVRSNKSLDSRSSVTRSPKNVFERRSAAKRSAEQVRTLKLLNYIGSEGTRAGLVKDSKIFELRDSEGKQIQSVDQILSMDLLEWIAENESKFVDGQQGVPIDSVRILTPILSPEKIYCAAVNYMSHSKEHKWEPPSEPYLFTKFRNSLVSTGEPIIAPKISSKVDWEAELAVIIGKKGKNIVKDSALDHVAGYTVANDVSFRDLQFPEKLTRYGNNWVKGKGLDSSFPLGPWLVTKDELNPYDSAITLSVNGVERQNSNIGEMIFKIDELIEYVSRGTTLVPGDVISTGTPMGVANFTGVPFLRDGDLVEASIEGIGALRNPVVAEK